jgi:hypothetical protein
MSLPNGTAVDVQQIETLCALIRLMVTHAPELRRRLSI